MTLRTASLASLLLLLGGCPGQASIRRDGAVYGDGAADAPRFTWPDYQAGDIMPGVPDLPKPPDLHPPQDYWPWAPDSYPATPFGCQHDADCFGQICCPMPWGVKLCVETCTLPP